MTLRGLAAETFAIARAQPDYPPCGPLWERWCDAYDASPEEAPAWWRLEKIACRLDDMADAMDEPQHENPARLRWCGHGEPDCAPGMRCGALVAAGMGDHVPWRAMSSNVDLCRKQAAALVRAKAAP